jgi:hypothetical protein
LNTSTHQHTNTSVPQHLQPLANSSQKERFFQNQAQNFRFENSFRFYPTCEITENRVQKSAVAVEERRAKKILSF